MESHWKPATRHYSPKPTEKWTPWGQARNALGHAVQSGNCQETGKLLDLLDFRDAIPNMCHRDGAVAWDVPPEYKHANGTTYTVEELANTKYDPVPDTDPNEMMRCHAKFCVGRYEQNNQYGHMATGQNSVTSQAR